MSSSTKLEWLIKTEQEADNVYELWNNDEKLVTLSLNQFTQTAKVECANSRRSFKIEKEGFLRNKTIIKNEYGIKIGQLGLQPFSNEGFIDLNEEKFYYSSKNEPPAELVIYKSSKKQPLVTCGIKPNSDDTFIHFKKNKETDKYSCLLMAISWFLFVPVTQEASSLVYVN
jgi:hypothetical protein